MPGLSSRDIFLNEKSLPAMTAGAIKQNIVLAGRSHAMKYSRFNRLLLECDMINLLLGNGGGVDVACSLTRIRGAHAHGERFRE